MSTVNAWNSQLPAQVSFGGTGSAGFGFGGVLTTNIVAPLHETAPGIDGAVLIGATGSQPAFGTITSTGGTITFTAGANSLNMESAGSGGVIAWIEVTGTSDSMVVNKGYIANNAGLVTLTLPATAAQGSIIRVVGKGAGGWKIAQNSGQTIHFGAVDTTTGAGGYLASSQRYDAIEILCITANTDFVVANGPQGNITYV